mgnify:FL=1
MDKFNKLVGDSEFMKKIIECTSTDEVKALFKSEGITVTDDELKVLADNINEAIEKHVNLSDEELNNISGGLLVRSIIKRSPPVITYKIGRGIIEGAIVANIGIAKSIRNGVKRTISWIRKI